MPVGHKMVPVLHVLAALVACLAVAQAQEGTDSATDLARCAWSTSAGVRLAVHGREMDLEVSSLAHPEPRTIECRAFLPGGQAMVVKGIHQGAVTETGWTFTYERSTGERRQLYCGSQEREFTFPVPAEWAHDKRIGIVIGIPGDNPGYLRLRELRLEPAPVFSPGSPEPVSPAEGQEVTPPAGDFLWACPKPGSIAGYDLEWRREGESVRRMHIAAYFTSDAQGFWPRRWLSPGKYAWRVRAQSSAGSLGPWSRMMHFAVRAEQAPQAPDVSPGVRNPLIILNPTIDDAGSAWALIPRDVRPGFLFRVGGSRESIATILAVAQAAGTPIALQVNGPHDIIAGHWDRVPLALLARWARQYPALKAFYICEQQVQGGVDNPEVTGYLERLIALGRESGRPVFWADANWGGNIWLEAEARPDFAEFLRANYGYVYPLWKMNGAFEPYLAPAGLLGLWLSQTVAAWGVQPESYYWTEAGFASEGVQRGYKEGERRDAPLAVFQELALLGASAGAEIYSFEPTDDFWGETSSHPELENLIWPLFRMLKDAVIPGLSEVQAAVVRKHVLDPADLVFRSDYTPAMRRLFAKTLGLAYPFQMIPASGDCYWIPFLPAAGTPADSDRTTGAVPGPGASRPSCSSDKAAVFRAGKATFVFNSRVNWPGEESFSIKLAGIPVVGRLGLNGWVTALDISDEQARLWFFARRGSRLVMDFDQPVFWLAPADRGLSPASGWNLRGASATTWSGPVRHLDISADRKPWDIAIRRSKRKSSEAGQ